MHPLLAVTAKKNYFDAAHYTWVLLNFMEVQPLSLEHMNEMLLSTGDYAAPLRTEHIRQPFDHMAVLFLWNADMKGASFEDSHFVLTVDSNNGVLQTVTLWSAIHGGDKRVLIIDFAIGQDEERLQKELAKERRAGTQVLESNTTNKTLFKFHKNMPDDIRKSMVDFFVPTIRKLLRYIPIASAGLLAGEQPVFHRPTGHASNAKRVKRGKAPLYEWTTVQLERKTPELPAAPSGGTHASPRLHQRRGHWATSKLGKKFWRRESVVGDPTKGMIFHDYKGAETHA